MSEFQQWIIVVDFDIDGESELEATAFTSDDASEQLHWASTDAHTLMAAVGRDLAAHINFGRQS